MTNESDETPAQESKTKGAVCYIPFIGWIISTFFILTEREDHYVRFNAIQSLLLLVFFVLIWGIVFNILMGVFEAFNLLSLIIGLVENFLPPAYLMISIYLIYKGFRGEMYMLPSIGRTAEKHM
jgi:uncharacterized membrane protein